MNGNLWESTISASDDLPKFDEFSKFLENRFRSLEFLDTKVRTKPVSKQSVLHALKTNSSSISLNNCQYCQGSHKIAHCKQFARQDYDSRQSFVQNNNLCFNCLGNNHSVYFCRQTSKCHVCKRKHHSLLHPNRKPSEVTIGNAESGVVNTVTETVQPNELTSITSCFSNIQSHVLLATAFVKVLSKNEVGITFRCLLDQGSQASFITENAVQTLGLKKIPTKVVISGVGGQEGLVSKHIVVANLQSIHDPHFLIKVKLHVLDKLTAFMPSKKFAVQLWSELSELRLADPTFYIPNKVDLLLGAEVYGQILEDGLIKGPPGSPVAQNTKFGWILSGQIYSSSHTGLECDSSNRIVSMHSYVDENEVLRRFWEIESDDFSYKKSKILTPEQQKCEEIFSHTTSRDDSGRYVVNLPFRDEDPRCKYGNSRKIATRRLQLLEKKLEKNTELKIQYSAVLQEYLDLGHMELVPEKEKEDVHVVYLPHHAVVKEDRTTSKIRIVFDASCKGGNGVSLNNDLLVGPVLQPDLRHIVLRWRQHPIILVADLVKMYRQIKVTKEHCNFQRIVWRDQSGNMQYYRLLRVTFGTNSAPYLAVKVLQQLSVDEGKNFKSIGDRVTQDFYMDDLMTGCQSVEEGIVVYKEMKDLMRRGGFQLQKWGSNSQELLEKIGEDKGNKNKEKRVDIGVEKGVKEVRKVLGLNWNSELDNFEYLVKLPAVSTPLTKRKVVADIARLFDPLGWISPPYCTSPIVRHSVRSNQPFMGNLPKSRVTPSKPFFQSGVDYDGPVSIRVSKGRGHHASKGYICLFVCMTTRAIHLESVSDLSAEGFLAAFKRFVARRGHCADLWSDNGTNFVGAAKELKKLLNVERSTVAVEIAEWLATNGTNWHNIPPYAPNFGGLWEAGIKSTKFHLKRVIGNSTLTYEEITTVLTQIEACLNSRPISQISDSIQDPYPLTPGHFLLGESLLLVPDANYENSNVSSLRRWQFTQRLVQNFWRRWSNEYLTQFLQRHKWRNSVCEPKIGDVVLVKEANLPPARWLHGIITEKHTGTDGVTRVVSLRCGNSQIKRPVSKLCLLPVTK
ncbi:unnamed protein product [Parnassius mnemosyne]|uniref:Integrase catalytic domain-containing protein n=1 Tax=Parnassius mnemosyne TaxID=213953 RepID=A0AAV1KPJ6_9NEOP